MKAPALWSVFNRVAGAGLKTCDCIKRDFYKGGFSVNIGKTLRRPIFKKILPTTASEIPASYCKDFFLKGFVLLLIQYLNICLLFKVLFKV